MRIMGLDIGQKRIGLALSDEMGWTAQPLMVLKRQALEKDIAALAGLVAEYSVQTIVVGLPRNMDGSLGPAAQKAEAFGQRLAEAVPAEVVYWDERWSTVSAERVLLEADVSRAKRKQVIDKLAASIILQGYLDRLSAQKDQK